MAASAAILGAVVLAPASGADEAVVAAKLSAKPQLKDAKLVDVPRRKANRIFVSIPVKYPKAGGARGGYRVKRLSTRVVLSSGRELQTKTSTGLVVPSRTRSTVHAHMPLSGGSGSVRRALTGGGSADVIVNARIGLDRDGNGTIDSTTRLQETTTVDSLTSPRTAIQQETPGKLGGSGSDPCTTVATYQGPANCVDQPGSTWESKGFMHSNTQRVLCPSGWNAVNEIPLFYGGNPAHTIDTNSSHYTDGAGMLGGAVGSNVSITDYNLHGHPIAYTPVIACCQAIGDSNPDACSGD